MPIITVKLLQGAFSHEQKHDMIAGITDVIARVGGEGCRPNVHVLIEDVASGMWGIGGERLTVEEIERRRALRVRSD
jgi:4-oxalocrotonate tautomerase